MRRVTLEPPLRRPADSRSLRQLSEQELGEALVAGVEGSLEECFHRWATLVNTAAWRLLDDAADAEEITQQVFVSAWRGRRTYRPELGSLPAWLLGNARHRVLDLQRRRTREMRLVRATSDEVGDTVVLDTPGMVVDRLLLADEVAKLGDPRRSILTLAFYEGCTYAEISDQLGLPLGTVKSHARRALLHLRERLVHR